MLPTKMSFILISSLALLGWSVTSLSLDETKYVEKYGAGTICDHCEDHCYSVFKYFVECYHEGTNDDCNTTACILNTMKGAKCDPNDSEPADNCPIEYDFYEWYMYQLARRNTTCSTDDPSTGMQPIIDWGECEYCSELGHGRCFTDSCTGDFWKQEYRWGNYRCE